MHEGKPGKRQDVLRELGYESADVKVRGIARLAIWFFALALGAAAVCYVVLFALVPGGKPITRAARDEAEKTFAQVPPPLIQADPTRDQHVFYQGQEALLHSYQMVDPQRGIVRIPVDRAMDIVLQRGLLKSRLPGPSK